MAEETKIIDEIRIKMLSQQRHLMQGQELVMPIGVAHEYITRKVAEVMPISKGHYQEFLNLMAKKK